MANNLSYILPLIGMLAGCAAEASSDQRIEIVFEGKISAFSVDEKIREISTHPKNAVTLVVKSAGGDALEAMRLGDAMLKNGVAMVVESYCHSACSSYLIPSATSVSIKGNAIVAFHGTPSFVIIPDDAPNEIKTYYDEFRKREETFLTERGVNYSAWLWVQSKAQTFCWFENSRLKKDDINRYIRLARMHLVVPSQLTFQQFGVQNISGVFPASAKQAWEFATQNGFRKSLAVAFVPALEMPDDWAPPVLPECTDEIRKEAGI